MQLGTASEGAAALENGRGNRPSTAPRPLAKSHHHQAGAFRGRALRDVDGDVTAHPARRAALISVVPVESSPQPQRHAAKYSRRSGIFTDAVARLQQLTAARFGTPFAMTSFIGKFEIGFVSLSRRQSCHNQALAMC